MTQEKKRYINIKLVGHGNYTMPADESGVLTLLEEIKEAEPGEKWIVELVEMTPEEYEKLPEFIGH